MNTTSIKLAVFFAHIQEAMEQTGRPVEDILQEIKGFGIEALEFDYEVLKNREEYFHNLLAEAGLKISSIYRFYDFGKCSIASNDFDLIDLAIRFDCHNVMAIPGFYTSSDTAVREKEFCNMLKGMKKLVEYGGSKEVQVLMEDFDDQNSPFCALEGLHRLMLEVPGIGCTFDTGNFIYDTCSGLEAFPQLSPFIKHVHFKDRMADFSPASVGNGIMQINEILKLLLQNNYHGYFSIEHFGAPDQLEYICQSAKWILAQLERGIL